MSQEQRFTTWLSDKEREALEQEARRQRTSMNYVVRSAIRQYLKLDGDPEPAPREPIVARQL